jgi:hypothetical protein
MTAAELGMASSLGAPGCNSRQFRRISGASSVSAGYHSDDRAMSIVSSQECDLEMLEDSDKKTNTKDLIFKLNICHRNATAQKSC